ncbi:hypothetical protein OO007_06540 [Cocleimonas sp. KMM 6892]|uniref:hypothetical protein n=1 Tax=unclassified Cocleimonas TaxID=2639732 RepID=UPI002DBE11C8|nr:MULTISPECIES: hypothetical protein [unclassified Cocleimonas]MEB8431880.1 hypothetical protein [Cocleimonas sp. KMM 6892]MEC4715034.1 hypothetical protein [Cocleimonas sp. KMM 6895]MEC4744152.1 hypothetical protein [Cocleimonas sp. KMM 6896]
MQEIIFVKKKLATGEWCAKCIDVSNRLEKDGTLRYIDRIVVADVNDAQSEGIQLALKHNMDRAPFFIVTDSNTTQIFDVYFKFKRHMQRFATAA